MFVNINSSALKICREFKGKSLIAFPESYTIIDLETTGLSPAWDSIIELSAIKIQNGNIIDQFSSLVNTSCGIQLDSFITELTGITQEMIDRAPVINSILPKYLEFIGNDIVIGHNVNFDLNFLYDNSMDYMNAPFSNDYIDTMRLSRRVHPEFSHHRLSDLAERYGVDYSGAHRSLLDCRITFECFNHIKEDIIRKYSSLDEFVSVSAQSSRQVRAKDIHSSKDVFDSSHPFYNKVCVFTGTLEKMKRKDAMQLVVDVGGIIGDSVTKQTNFLILGNNDYCSSIKDGESNKQKKAEKLKSNGCDIEIIPENVFYDLILDNSVNNEILQQENRSNPLSEIETLIIDLTRQSLHSLDSSDFRYEKKGDYLIGRCFYPLFKIKISGKIGIYFVNKNSLSDDFVRALPLRTSAGTSAEWNNVRVFLDDLPADFAFISEIIKANYVNMDMHIKHDSDHFYSRFKKDFKEYLNDSSLIKL